MNLFWRDDHTTRLTLLGVSLTLFYLTVLVPFGFFENPRAASADLLLRWRNRHVGPPPQTKEIVIIAIDDESQKQLNQKWPWDRMVFAQFIRQLSMCKPKTILLDFAFAGTSQPDSDAALAQAIQEGPPTLLGAYLNKDTEQLQPMMPYPGLLKAGAIPALIDKPIDRDHVVRRLWTFGLPNQNEPIYSLEIRTAALLWGIPPAKIFRDGSFLRIGAHRIPAGRLGQLPINYLARPEEIRTIPFWRILQNNFNPTQIQDKLILVGTTSEILHDIHPTPLGRMPGVVIEANGLLTILNRRFIKEFPLWTVLTLSLCWVIGILQIGYHLRIMTGLLVTIGLVGFAILAEFFLTTWDISAEFGSTIALGGIAWLVSFIYRHLILLGDALRLQRQAITDGFSNAFTPRYFNLRLQQECQRAQRTKHPVSVALVQILAPSHQLETASWSEVQGSVQKRVKSFKQIIPEKGIVGRVEESRFALLLPKTSLSQTRKLAEKIQEDGSPMNSELAIGIACSDQGCRRAEDLLRCAESALNRSQRKGIGHIETYDPSVDKVQLDKSSSPSSSQSAPTHLEYVASELEERNRALEKALEDLRQLHKELESAFLDVTKSLVLALETKDAYTAGHLERVCRYATRLAETLGLPKEDIEAIREAALLHDIGKIGLPDEVLHKVGKLSESERTIIRQHLEIGAKILEPMKFFRSITKLVYHHHEWYNGQGYPYGLAGDLIPAGAQMIAIADAFDAMTTQRSYNKPFSPQEALVELKKGASAQFNPLYVEKFIEIMNQEWPQRAASRAP